MSSHRKRGFPLAQPLAPLNPVVLGWFVLGDLDCYSKQVSRYPRKMPCTPYITYY